MNAITRAQLLRHPQSMTVCIVRVSTISNESSFKSRIKCCDNEDSNEHERESAKISFENIGDMQPNVYLAEVTSAISN